VAHPKGSLFNSCKVKRAPPAGTLFFVSWESLRRSRPRARYGSITAHSLISSGRKSAVLLCANMCTCKILYLDEEIELTSSSVA